MSTTKTKPKNTKVKESAETINKRIEKLNAEAKIIAAKKKAENDKRIALLPFATPEQMKQVVAAIVAGKPLPEGCRPNVDFRFSPEQVVTKKEARQRHETNCTKNQKKITDKILSDPLQNLKSCKVRVTKSNTTTSMKWVKKKAVSVKKAKSKKDIIAKRNKAAKRTPKPKTPAKPESKAVIASKPPVTTQANEAGKIAA